MSLKIEPPFKLVPRISEVAITDPDEVSLRKLRDAVAGRSPQLTRSRAMEILLASDFPNKHRDLQAVLMNDGESPEVRAMAALYLGKVNTPAAREVLVEASSARDTLVLGAVASALGRIGDETSLEVVSRILDGANGLAAEQARFAAALLSHRLDVRGPELQTPNSDDYLKLPPEAARPFRVEQTGSNEAELCLRSLADQSFGIELAEHPMYQVRCGNNAWMLLLSRDAVFPGATERLRTSKSLAGIIAIKDRTTRLYSSAFLVLTAPSKQSDGVAILIHRTTGDLIFAGTMQVVGRRASFALGAVRRPGAFPMELSGSIEDGYLDIHSARSTQFVAIEKRQATPERRITAR